MLRIQDTPVGKRMAGDGANLWRPGRAGSAVRLATRPLLRTVGLCAPRAGSAGVRSGRSGPPAKLEQRPAGRIAQALATRNFLMLMFGTRHMVPAFRFALALGRVVAQC